MHHWSNLSPYQGTDKILSRGGGGGGGKRQNINDGWVTGNMIQVIFFRMNNFVFITFRKKSQIKTAIKLYAKGNKIH